MDTNYKVVVKNANDQWFSAWLPWAHKVEYSTKFWSKAWPGTGLCTFQTLKQAERFINHHCWEGKIFTCLCSQRVQPHYTIVGHKWKKDFYDEFYNFLKSQADKHKKILVPLRNFPDGTLLYRRVKLLKQVTL